MTWGHGKHQRAGGVHHSHGFNPAHTCELCPQVDVELPFLGALQGCLQEALKATSQQMKAGDADKSQLIPELPPGWKIPLCAITRTGPK